MMESTPPRLKLPKRQDGKSWAVWIASLGESRRREVLTELVTTEDEWRALNHEWTFWARPDQFPPEGHWFLWLMLSGRGAGKSRAGAEWVHREAMEGDERRRIALIGKTPGDVRDVMIEGISGITRIAPPHERPEYQPTKRRLTWPTGATATVFSGANPEQTRGFSGDRAWCDEVSSWKYPRETWDNLLFGMREAQIDDPRIFVSTTPKPQPLIRELLAKAEDPDESDYRFVRTSSYANRLNLSPVYYKTVIQPLEGTTLGEQEIHARILADDPDAYWKRSWIEANRVTEQQLPRLSRIVIAIDAATSKEDENNETGIVVAGVDGPKGLKQHGFVLEDESGRYSPNEWGRKAISLYKSYKADLIVAERNQGGDMVENTIKTIDPTVNVKPTFSTRGKAKRFEPVANLDEQGRVHHVGTFGDMEDQMCTWHEGARNLPSPDRADARAWAISELMISGHQVITSFDSFGSDKLTHTPGWRW